MNRVILEYYRRAGWTLYKVILTGMADWCYGHHQVGLCMLQYTYATRELGATVQSRSCGEFCDAVRCVEAHPSNGKKLACI